MRLVVIEWFDFIVDSECVLLASQELRRLIYSSFAINISMDTVIFADKQICVSQLLYKLNPGTYASYIRPMPRNVALCEFGQCDRVYTICADSML